jgi:uncharacterized DUF497 family protein
MHSSGMDIEFDPHKNRKNITSHGISFAEVEAVFFDAMAITVQDNDHDEQRMVTLGMDAIGRIIVVCYLWRGSNIRVISARKAELHERRIYEGKR